MIQAGRVILLRIPQTNQASGKLRPALVIRKLPDPYDDWLICMISSQLPQYIPGFDEIIKEEDADFGQSGLKISSVIRISRLAVVEKSTLLGSIGSISDERLNIIKNRLSNWIKSA